MRQTPCNMDHKPVHSGFAIAPCNAQHHYTTHSVRLKTSTSHRPCANVRQACTWHSEPHASMRPTTPRPILRQRRLADGRPPNGRSRIGCSRVGHTCTPGCATVRTGCRSRGRPVVPEVNTMIPPEREPSDSHSAPKSATHATKREGKSGSAVAQREEGSLIRRVRRRLWLGTPARCGCGRMRRRVCCGRCRLLPCTFRAGSGAGAGDVVDVLRVAYLLQSRRVQNVKIEKDDEPGRQVFLV